MGCDYYIRSELIVEYIDANGALSTTRTNRTMEKGYLMSVPDEDSDDDLETLQQKYNEELQKIIDRHNYKKMLYETGEWKKESYKKKYLQELNILCPRMIKIVKVYKEYTAWKRF